MRREHEAGEVVAGQRCAAQLAAARRPLLAHAVDGDLDSGHAGDLRCRQHDLRHAVDQCLAGELLKLAGDVDDENPSVETDVE